MGKIQKIELILACLALFLAVQPCLGAQEAPKPPSPQPLDVPRIEEKISVDGRLDEPAWQQALLLDLPVETEPGENIPAPVRTEVRVFYGKDAIYFGLECFDPQPEQIRARFAERDSFDADDLININLDTFNDERRNYFFGCNPLGVQRDGLETTGGDGSWDAIWASAGRIHERGYTIEMAIPFSSLQFQRSAGPQVWGLDISRWYPRSQRRRLGLVPIDRNNNSYQCQFMKIRGFAGIRPGKSIEIVPTLTGAKTDGRESMPGGGFAGVSQNLDPGLTVKWGVTSNLTFNGTANPDFSQVEADARQLDVNQPFALYYQEKRPFFTEGADFFSTPFRAIYTRTLRDPRWGLKLSGKEGANTIGAYFVQDDLTNLIFPGSQGSDAASLDRVSSALVLRTKRDFGSRYTLGALFTNRSGDDYFNRVFGFDGAARFTGRDKVTFQFLGSATAYPDDVALGHNQPLGTLADTAFGAQYVHQTRNLTWYLEYDDVGPEFRADLGFMPKVGYREAEAGIEYSWLRNRGWWSRIELGYDFSYAEDHDGGFLYRTQGIDFFLSGDLQSFLYLGAAHGRESFRGRTFEGWAGEAHLEMQPLSVLWLGVNAEAGDSIDYANARLGSRIGVNPAVMVKAGRRLAFQVDHNYERMRVGGAELYTAHITQGSAIFHLNLRAFFRAIVQYVDYRYNAANYAFPVEPEVQRFFSQLLFSYKLNPRTVFFLGYSDNALGTREFPLTRSDRTLFMKVSYSWQM